MYAESADVVSIDIYPIYNNKGARNPSGTDRYNLFQDRTLSAIGKYQRLLNEEVLDHAKPTLAVLQAWTHRLRAGYILTEDEVRFQAYDAIINGADGLMWFGWHVWGETNDDTWNRTKEFVRDELGDPILYPVLSADTSPHHNSVSVNTDDIEFLLKEYNGQQYLFAANTSHSTTHSGVTFSGLSSHATSAEVLFESRTVSCSGGQISGESFDVYGRHVYKLNNWSGSLAQNTTWSGTIIVSGDVTIPSGVTLTIEPGTQVHFVANSDDTGSGNAPALAELIVENGGALEATGYSIFRSTTEEPEPTTPEWYGFHVASGGHVHLEDVTIRDAVHCVPDDLSDALLETLTLRNCGTPPTIEGDSMPEFPEDSTEPVAAYTAEDAEGDAVEWSLGTDADEAAFTLTSAGVLDFEEPPDFETLNGDSLFYVTVRATDRQEAFTDYPVTVTVRNVEEAGTVVLSPLPPEVDQELTAALEDVDGVLSVDGWTWQRAASATAAEEDWTIIAETDGGEPTNHYTPQLSDVGWVLQATAYYADGHGPNKSEVSAPTAAVIGPELVGPERLTFVEHGTFVEDGKAVVPTYTVSGVDGTATWSLDGTDAGAFDLAAAASGGVSLSFSSPPNYEDPTDTDEGGPNTYYVTVVATLTAAAETAENSLADLFAAFQRLSDDSPSAQASSSALTQAVVVTVENGDDPGVVELLPAGPPRVGHSLTARLVDEDEDLTDMVWTWLADGDVVRPASPSGETTDGYEPQPEDEGRALQTQVRYKDPFGAKTVVSAPTAAVLPAGVVSLSPNPPRLCQPVTAELSGPEEVTGETWTWERQRQGSDKWDLLWSSSSPDKTASDSDLAYLFSAYNRGSGKVSRYQPTEEDLDRVLRATVSWDGHEASDRAPVGASAPGLPRHLEGEGRAAKVVLSWRTPNNCGSAITGYEYQYRLAEETHYYHDDDRPWGEVGQGANRRLTAASYRRRDFLRMLAGGYDVGGHPEPFVTPEHGPNITVANNHQLPAVFGSVRAYFEAVSDGAFHLIAQTQTL